MKVELGRMRTELSTLSLCAVRADTFPGVAPDDGLTDRMGESAELNDD